MIMGSRFLQLLLMLVVFLCIGTNAYSFSGADSKVKCIESEQEALLKFKQGFIDLSNRFSSCAAEEDCCKWRGVRCNDTTGHVIILDIHSSNPMELLQGELGASLVNLSYLSYLDLSMNNFRQIRIPEFIGSLSNLKYLNLSRANFKGTIPNHLGNLLSLQSLDLSGNDFSLRANNLDWLYGLSSIHLLDLGGVDLSNEVDWFKAINMLPSLVELRLFACKLRNLPPSVPFVNFTSLKVLDLSFNNFDSVVPHWLFNISHSLAYLNLKRNLLRGPIPNAFGNMTALTVLDLSKNCLEGGIPNAFGNMTALTVLDLSKNYLDGGIPTTLGLIRGDKRLRRSSSLRELYLSDNQFNGSLEQSFVQLSELQVLDVSLNSFEGVIGEAQLLNFSSLRVLNLSSNFLAFNMSSTWIPTFQLNIIGLQSCKLGPKFPKWLQTQKNFSSIDISNAGISDTVPDWFWKLSSTVEYMNLSYNELRGKVPDFSSKFNLSILDLSRNYFEGPLPHFYPNVKSLILAGNSFSGPISHLCEVMSVNNSMSYLDLSENLLSGLLPDCWTYGKNLFNLNLADNNLSGEIPDSIGHLVRLSILVLNNNSFFGDLPLSLKYCASLFILDLGENRLSGNIPSWIGEGLPFLMILRLSSNAFEGNIPVQLCRLQSLRILDLASNNISGVIPRCVNNFFAMAEMGKGLMAKSIDDIIFRSYLNYILTYYVHYLKVTYFPFISLKVIDLSSNSLSGEIPGEITSLIGLSVLNLSRNHLTGTIPRDIGTLEVLEALDLSRNQLSCTIPTSMPNLSFLAVLNLSYNNLSGKIPLEKQFATFEAESYMENHNLCGSPLAKDCLGDESYEDPHCSNKEESIQEDGKDGFEVPSFYISMGLGFFTGFWGFLVTLLVNSSWRYAYYRFLDRMCDQIYVIIAINVARLRRKLQSQQVLG